MARFSDIKRGAQLKTALDRYIEHIQTAGTRPRRIGQYGARNLTTYLYFKPFTIDVAADEVVVARCTPESDTKLRTIVDGVAAASVSSSLGANSVVSLPKFRAARIVYFENGTRSVQVTSSQITGQEYLKYAGERFSLPFGAAADTDDMMDAFAQAKAAILEANSAAEVKRVSLTRERIGVEAA